MIYAEFGKSQSVKSEDESNDQNGRAGGAIQLSHRESSSSHQTQTGERRSEETHNKKKGMILPFEPHSITFDDVEYAVDMPQVTLVFFDLSEYQTNYSPKITWLGCLN